MAKKYASNLTIDKNTMDISARRVKNAGSERLQIIAGAGEDHTITGSQVEKVTGNKSITAASVTEEIAGDKTVEAESIFLAPTKPLRYGTPAAYNDYFKSVPMLSAAGDSYNVLVAADGTADLGSAAPYHSYKEFGIDNTGVEDCSDKLAAITDNVALSAGTYLIAKDCTVSVQVVAAAGVSINVEEGATLTLNDFYAPRVNVFTGSGSVAIEGWIFPEWFNKNINRSYSAGRLLSLSLDTYTITENLILSKKNTCITGPSFNNPNFPDIDCIINCSSYSIQIGTTGKTTINDYPSGITIENLAIIGSVTLQQSLYARINNVYSITDQIYNFNSCKCVSPIFYGVYAQNNSSISGATCFNLQNDDDTSQTDRPISMWFTNCTAACTKPNNTNSYGWRINGHSSSGRTSDLYINNCEIVTPHNGITFIDIGNEYSFNIHINGLYIDQFRNHAVGLFNCAKIFITITDLYAMGSSATTTPAILSSNSSATITLNGAQIGAFNARELMNLTNCSVLGNNIEIITTNNQTPIILSGNNKYSLQYILEGNIYTITNIE